MKTAKQIIAGIAMLGALLSFTTTASADWSHRGRELRHDRRELGAARRELRSWGWRDDDHGRRPGWWNWRR